MLLEHQMEHSSKWAVYWSTFLEEFAKIEQKKIFLTVANCLESILFVWLKPHKLVTPKWPEGVCAALETIIRMYFDKKKEEVGFEMRKLLRMMAVSRDNYVLL